MITPKKELLNRIRKIHTMMDDEHPDWSAVFIVDKVNQYYLTGTMQNAIFVLKNDGDYGYFVRGSLERAKLESPLEHIFPMVSYKDLQGFMDTACPHAFVEGDVFSFTMMERLNKYFKIGKISSCDDIFYNARAVKSEHELKIMRESGIQHAHLLDDIVPTILREGMSEPELTARLYTEMIALGYQGITRFSMFQTELIIGHIGFGESSVFPTCFDGPGGNRGTSPAVPTVGSRERLLKKGDLVFIDIAYGVRGYHTDRTQLYMFGAEPTREMLKIQHECWRIEQEVVKRLTPGNIPSRVYAEIMAEADLELLTNFMGNAHEQVKFVGHGVGLRVDEYPVLARGFDRPLEENMTIAVEPKNGLAGVGLLGVEDTFVVTPKGGESLTGGADNPHDSIIVV
ncbi:MAG: M24 family metallopeptidase [Clostridiales bacterium]|jgi:Xaa-Pro aminopeptidase|nr:M24 family metallopeptidase [Clostridiales bacterium]